MWNLLKIAKITLYMEGLPKKNENSNKIFFKEQTYNNIAEIYKNHNLLKKLFSPSEMSDYDSIRKDKSRDLDDFTKRLSLEFQKWDENLKPVLSSLLKKRNNMEDKSIRALLYILPGGMKGPYCAGTILGLNEMGMNKTFDVVVGTSTGAGAVSYFAAGVEQSLIGASIYYENCISKDFLDFRRINKVMDVGVVISALREGDKALDQGAVKKARAEVYYGVTDKENGTSEMINAKTAVPSMFDAIEASMTLPLLYKNLKEVNGKQYIDGIFAPISIKDLIKKFDPTDILVLPNVPFDHLESFELNMTEEFIINLLKFVPHFGSLNVVEKFIRAKEEFRKLLEEIQEQNNVRIGVMWPPDSGLESITIDPKQIEMSIIKSFRKTIEEFGGEQPEEINLYHSGKKY